MAKHVGLCMTCLKIEYSILRGHSRCQTCICRGLEKLISSFLFSSFGTCVIPEWKIFHTREIMHYAISQNAASVFFKLKIWMMEIHFSNKAKEQFPNENGHQDCLAEFVHN